MNIKIIKYREVKLFENSLSQDKISEDTQNSLGTVRLRHALLAQIEAVFLSVVLPNGDQRQLHG